MVEYLGKAEGARTNAAIEQMLRHCRQAKQTGLRFAISVAGELKHGHKKYQTEE